MVSDIGARNLAMEYVKVHLLMTLFSPRFCVLQMKPRQIVNKHFLEFGLFLRLAFHKGAQPSGVLGPLEHVSIIVETTVHIVDLRSKKQEERSFPSHRGCCRMGRH